MPRPNQSAGDNATPKTEPNTSAPQKQPIIIAQIDEDAPPLDDTEVSLDNLPEELEGGQQLEYTLRKDAKERLDKFLQSKIKGMSRHQVQKLIALGGVTVNRKTPKPSARLRKDDHVCIWTPPRPTAHLNPEPIDLDIIYEDEGFIVVNKQAGLIVHPARSHLNGTLLNALAYHFQQSATPDTTQDATLSNVGQREARPGVIHRLDKNTTGVIVVGKQDQPHWLIAKQFENRTNLKAYLAVVHGCPDPLSGVIDQPLGKHPTIREAHAVRQDSTGKESVTLYRVRRRYQGYSLVELELKTGRTHQIRVHMSYIGHPLVGDIIYGGEPVGLPEIENPPHAAGAKPFLNFARNKAEGLRVEKLTAQRDDIIMAHPALHAALLRLDHPQTDKPITFTAPVHQAMLDLINTLQQHAGLDLPTINQGCHVDLTAALPGDAALNPND
jgi:23S rRNA pseudouridine1911/1915/1917 synthase